MKAIPKNELQDNLILDSTSFFSFPSSFLINDEILQFLIDKTIQNILQVHIQKSVSK